MKYWLAIMVAFTFCAVPMTFADTIVGSSGAGWQSNYIVNQNGTPYWDSSSLDGTKKNIGYCLTGTGNCGMPGAPGALDYWGYSNGNADLDIGFMPTSGGTAALEIEIAGYSSVNEFGYQDSTGNHILFTGPQGTGSTAVIAAVGEYYFFIVSGNGQTYYTDSSLNPHKDQDFQHFAIFDSSPDGTYWLGMEDLADKVTDADYNDMVVKITPLAPAPVPEPSSLILLGTGGLGILGTVRRKLLRS